MVSVPWGQLALGDRGRRVSSVPNNNCSGQLCGKWFSYQPIFGCPFLSNKAWHSRPVSLENLSSMTDMPSTSRKQVLLAKAEEILLQILLLAWIGATHTGRTSLSLSKFVRDSLYVNRQESNFSFFSSLGREMSCLYIELCLVFQPLELQYTPLCSFIYADILIICIIIRLWVWRSFFTQSADFVFI